MFHPKPGASFLRGCLFYSAAPSAFVLSALAGGVILSGGEAKAAACSGNPSLPSTDLPLSIPFIDTLSNASSALQAGFVRCDVELTGLTHPHAQNIVNVIIDINPPLTGSVTLSYSITMLPDPVWFDQVSLGFNDLTPGGETVRKQVFGGGPTGPLLADLLSSGSVVYASLPGQYSTLFVVDTMSANGGAIGSVTNSFRNVPGPLPILGVGAAFGFSRKLRGRIKAARTA